MWSQIIHSSYVHAALAGWLAAALVDIHAFLRWKSAHDAATYDYPTMLLRWGQGIVGGLVMATGLTLSGAS